MSLGTDEWGSGSGYDELTAAAVDTVPVTCRRGPAAPSSHL
ncbi:hypothetical protein AB0C18_43125 [Nonomuraea muscovyensis]